MWLLENETTLLKTITLGIRVADVENALHTLLSRLPVDDTSLALIRLVLQISPKKNNLKALSLETLMAIYRVINL